MAIDISIGSRFDDDAYFATPGGTVYVYGSTNAGAAGGTSIDTTQYWTKTQIGNGDASAYLVYRSPEMAQTILGVKTFHNQTVFTEDISVGTAVKLGGDLTAEGDASISGSLNAGDTIVSSLISNTDISVGDDLLTDEIWGHTPFVSGFTGTGYQLIQEPEGTYRLELDNLMVRGSLTAYEMILHKIRALNGSLWVSSAVEAVWPGEASTYIPAGLYYGYDSFGKYGPYFYTESNNNTLVKNDYIRSQQFLGNNIHQVDWVVRDSSGDMIFVNNLYTTSVVDASWMAPTSNTYELINIDASSLTLSGASDGYDLLMTEQGQKIKTGYFTVRGAGLLQATFFWLTQTSPYKYIRSRIEYGDGSILTEWRDSSTSDWSAGPYYVGGLGSYEITDTTFTGDSSCYIVIENMEPDVSIDIFSLRWNNLLDYTIPYRDVTGFTFVRRGNDQYENRQGAIYLTADDENAPFIEVLDDMTSHDIAASNRKVRLGKLDGLSWRDASIGGYGLWSDSVYLTGGIQAEYGTIGNFEIDSGKIIGTGTNSDRIILDPDLPSMILTDASQSIVAEVTNQPILSIDDIQSTTEILYAGSEADTYTDINQQYPQSSYYSGARYWRPTIYIKNHQTTGNTDLDASTSERDNTYDIQVEDGGTYSVNMSVNVNVTTLLPESSAGGYHTPPSYDVPEEPVEVEKHFYSLGGYYTINASTYFFAGDDTSLGNTHKTNFGSLTSSLSNWQVVTNKSITATDTSVYIKLVPEIKNALYALDYVEYWYSVENEYGEWVWQEVYSTTMDRDVSTLFNIEVEQLGLNGRLQKTQIGQDGILTYWNSDKYFTVNNREDPLIQSAGGWTHNMTSSQNIRINHNGESATFNTPFALACAEQGWMMILQNKRANSDAQGILLDTGKTSGSNTSMTFRTYNGNSVGSITHNGTNATYGTSSDARLKGNIRDASIDALELIKSLPVREWEWNTTGENDCGFVAQEVLEIYPRMVQVPRDPSTEYYGVGTQHLVPILVKALQEAMERIEKLEEDILILKG